MENPMLDFADYISRAYKDGFNDGVASVAKPFGNGMDVCPVCGSPSTIGKSITNADRIRAMTDEELAEFIWDYNFMHHDKPQELLDWLREEAEEEEI